MPFKLTNTFNPGDLDSVVYKHIKIVNFYVDLDNKTMEIRCQYGNVVSGVWTPGKIPDKSFSIYNIPDQRDSNGDIIPDSGSPNFNTLVSQKPKKNNETIYQSIAVELYNWLKDNNKFSGTIE